MEMPIASNPPVKSCYGRGACYRVIWLLFFVLFPLSLSATPDIVFITQPPHPADFATTNATFGNHQASLDSIPRGGDLYIRYANGTLKNITAAAGYGNAGFQGSNAIAVRDPAVHWSGSKIIFSMVIGAPTQRYQVQSYRWQLYEVTGIGQSDTPVITKVPNQSSEYNNVMPIYGTDDRIIFISDRPRAGLTHTYPQRDEYESTPTNTGIWSLDPTTGDTFQIDHSPSGDFNPSLDSYGRVVFTRWDHLQRDQQNRCSQSGFGAFNYSSEDPDAQAMDSDAEVYPEARAICDAGYNAKVDRHTFNSFLPWQVNQDGTELETINHIGRHELLSYLGKSFNDDPDIEEFYRQYSRFNDHSIENFFQIHEDPHSPGNYYGISAPEFGTHASGQIIKMYAPPGLTADKIPVAWITHPDTSQPDDTPSSDHAGLSRDPLPLSDGTLVASHSGTTRADSNIGSSSSPQSRYAFRLRTYTSQGSYVTPDVFLTSGITKSVSYWSPDEMISYSNTTLWELQAKEIRSRSRPTTSQTPLADPERQMFAEAQVDSDELKAYLRENNLALIVSRNVTTRDELDKQQPYNLQVAGTSTQTTANSGKLYQISLFQIFQGDLIRGYNGSSSSPGRRVLAQPLHSTGDVNPLVSGVSGAVEIASDGSVAAFVPARQALTYQLTESNGNPVVRERLWLTFQPGEIRVCASCHGVNGKDQSGNAGPQNAPLALKNLLEYWKGIPKESPELDLSLRTMRAGKSSKEQKLEYKVTGRNSSAAQKQFTLTALVGKFRCGSLTSFTTDRSGGYTGRTRVLPAVLKKTSVRFSLEYYNKQLVSKNYSMRKTSKRGIKPAKLCAALKKSFRR